VLRRVFALSPRAIAIVWVAEAVLFMRIGGIVSRGGIAHDLQRDPPQTLAALSVGLASTAMAAWLLAAPGPRPLLASSLVGIAAALIGCLLRIGGHESALLASALAVVIAASSHLARRAG
jgi:hypothetical protein